MLLALLVTLPWTSRGWLLLLDWVPGPHVSALRSFWGLDNGLQAGQPFWLAVLALSGVVGPATAGWLAVALALAVAGVSAGHLAGGGAVRRMAAGTLYAVNPLIFDRLFAGHVGYLLAYALLPLFVASVLRRRGDISWRGMRPALWLALLTGLTPHLLWIGGVVLAAALVTSPTRRALGWTALVVALTLAASSYFIVPSIGRPPPVRVGEADLAAFRTRSDPTLGLAPNVAGLYGFWRQGPRLAKDGVAGWPVFLGAIVVLAGAGLWKAGRQPATRALSRVVGVSGVAGFVLALGDQGPTGPVFRWLFEHLPGFAIMREPQKFVALLALAYAVGFGLAVDGLARGARGKGRRVATGAVAVALPVLYTPTLFLGLGGQVEVARYPASWSTADALMGDGDGRLLFLPWHLYLGFPFTNRVIANPAENFFRREVVAGDNVELANLATASNLRRSEYLEFLYANGNDLCAFGRLVAPLGVEYVALSKTVDASSYAWLTRQRDLEVVLDRPEITLYRNVSYHGPGTRTAELARVAHWGELATLANAGRLGDAAYTAVAQRPGPVTAGPCPPDDSPTQAGGVRRRSPVAYQVEAGEAGYVALAEPYDPSWRLGGEAPVELAGGLVAFPSDGEPATARFGHWAVVRLSYGLSLAVTALLVAGPRLGRVWRRARSSQHALPGNTDP